MGRENDDSSAAGAAPLTPAMADVLAERRRQVEVEGWHAQHDDLHDSGQMAKAAACYAAGDVLHLGKGKTLWPWDAKWWKPKDRRRDLVQAGALIIAEIERLDRAAQAEGTSHE